MFQHISTETKLRDAVNGYNDEVRWNRLDLAHQRVDPKYRASFRVQHAKWGRHVQVADVNIDDVQVSDDREEAVSYITYQWYDQSTMTLATTRIKQVWSGVVGGFTLANEEIIEGNTALFLELEEEDGESKEAKARELPAKTGEPESLSTQK